MFLYITSKKVCFTCLLLKQNIFSKHRSLYHRTTQHLPGTPSPTIHFEYKNGTQIRNKGRFYVTSTSLEIWAAQVSDTSEYKCLGQNGDETVTANFKVTVSLTKSCSKGLFISLIYVVSIVINPISFKNMGTFFYIDLEI